MRKERLNRAPRMKAKREGEGLEVVAVGFSGSLLREIISIIFLRAERGPTGFVGYLGGLIFVLRGYEWTCGWRGGGDEVVNEQKG